DTLMDFAKYVGANPVPMNLDEVYLALQTGQVDGQDNPLPGVEANSFEEVQDYIALTNHVVNDNSYAVSELTWEELPEDLQQILSDGIDEATDFHTELFEDEEEELIEYFEDEGLTVTEPDLDEFEEEVSEVYPEYLEEIGDGAEEYMEIIDDDIEYNCLLICLLQQIYNNVEEIIGSIVFVVMLIVLMAQTLAHQGFGTALMWSEQLGKILFIYAGYIGVVAGIKDNSHVAIDVVLTRIPKNVRKLV